MNELIKLLEADGYVVQLGQRGVGEKISELELLIDKCEKSEIHPIMDAKLLFLSTIHNFLNRRTKSEKNCLKPRIVWVHHHPECNGLDIDFTNGSSIHIYNVEFRF